LKAKSFKNHWEQENKRAFKQNSQKGKGHLYSISKMSLFRGVILIFNEVNE
jgi:hypothetical protein